MTDENDDSLIQGFEQDSDFLWRDDRWWAITTLFGPLLLTSVLVAFYALVNGAASARQLVVTALAAFFVLGRFVILGGRDVDSGGFTPGQLALMVFYLDVMTAIIISWHAGALFRIPWLGKRLRFLMHTGREVLDDNRWMRHTTFLGIIAFVMFPLASSGSIGGSLFGRLLGLSRAATFAGVVFGSVLGCGTMYYGATVINRYVDQESVVLRWGGVAALVVLIALLNRRYRKSTASDSSN